MKTIFRNKAILAASLVGCSISAYAIPLLQLDIDGGTYVGAPIQDTVINTGNNFTLQALLATKPNGPDKYTAGMEDGFFYISAAVVRLLDGGSYAPLGSSSDSLGSFIFDGITIDVTADMLFGVPPVDAEQDFDAGDLSKHGVYETWFMEFAFSFAGDSMGNDNVCNAENGLGCVDGFIHEFTVNVGGLTEGYGIHFDLYTVVSDDTDIDVKKSAPFSHDATAFDGGGGGNPQCLLNPDLCVDVPEPGTLALMGLGLIGVSMVRRRVGA
jgi:hypothetical protein